MFWLYVLLFILVFVPENLGHIRYPQKTCHGGDVVQNECNKCICSHNMYHCTPLPCANSTAGEYDDTISGDQVCHPNMIYISKNMTCVCSYNGTWPHDECLNTFKMLPKTNSSKVPCERNSYIMVDCNVCYCDSEGNIDEEKCTKNECNKKPRYPDLHHARRVIDSVTGKCKPGYWYSFDPCQYCYCAYESKLICNAGVSKDDSILELGTYKLTICGQNFLTEAQNLLPSESPNELRERFADSITNPPITEMYNVDTNVNVEIHNEDKDERIDDDDNSESDGFKLIEYGDRNAQISQTAPPYYNTEPTTPKANTIQIDFPMVLDKLINMVLRKSMVKLDTQAECEPGTTENIECNVCFCLVNGKKLCTDKVC